MFTNRISIVLIVLSVVALGLLSLSHASFQGTAVNTTAAASKNAFLAQRVNEWAAGVSAEQAQFDQRYGEWTAGQPVHGDHSYDAIEGLRNDRAEISPVTDRSYDAIENLRAQRTN